MKHGWGDASTSHGVSTARNHAPEQTRDTHAPSQGPNPVGTSVSDCCLQISEEASKPSRFYSKPSEQTGPEAESMLTERRVPCPPHPDNAGG